MKKILYIFALIAVFFQPTSVFAQSDTEMKFGAWMADSHADPLGRADFYTIQYESYDGKKNRETVSAKIYVPRKEDGTKIKHVILACHPTTTNNMEVPTGIDQMDKEIKRLVYNDDFSTMIICPDYCGYGISSHKQHPYLIHDVTARNCVDAVYVVLTKYVQDVWGYTLDSDYATDIVGYSQGGATALACAKYLDSDACPDYIKETVKLQQTTCGDGPYSTLATVNKYIEWGIPKNDYTEQHLITAPDEDLAYACVLPLIVAAAKDAYDDGCMKTVKVEDFFEEQFLKSKVLEYIKTKSVGTTFISEEIAKVMDRQRPVDVFSSKIINKETGWFNTTSNEYKCLMRALEKADLTKGWVPKHDIYFFHLQSDKVVPYANYEAIAEGIGKDCDKVHYVDAVEAHKDVVDNLHVSGWSILGLFVGDKFSTGVLNKAEVNYFDFSNVDHSTGGTIFYTDYMFSSKLRKW